MRESLFGTDGVRGRVGQEPITPHTIMKLGWAAGCVFAEAGKGDKVLIGKDTRVSGYMLESALEAGFAAAGVNVSLLGPMPTPGIAYLTRTARACAGVVISASHNLYYDNGIKIFSPQGTKLDDDLVAQIDAKMREPMTCVVSGHIGRAERFTDAHGRYIEYCKSTFPSELSLANLRIVIDCANGAGYEVGPRVLSELGAEVIALGNHPDGININDECGSTSITALVNAVKEHQADIGIALDGDADRVLLVDEMGDIVNGDQILYVLAKHRLVAQTLGGGVAGTLMTNLGLELALAELSIPFVRSKVGDRHVHEVLSSKGWLLGGEASGHIICLDKSTTGDGIVAGLEVLQVMLSEEQSLSELVSGMEVYPQTMINVNVEAMNARVLLAHDSVTHAVQDAESELGKTGRVLLRASGTEPLIRVMIEGNNAKQVQRLCQSIADVVAAVKN